MQLTIKATGEGVQAVSFLLAKNPVNVYERNQRGHIVRFFYSSFTETEVEATIFVTPDPIELTKSQGTAFDITHYINDREFAVSSIFFSLVRSALGTALNGQPKEGYEKWAAHPFAFEFGIGPIASSFSDQQIRALFEPLGFEAAIARPEVDYTFRLRERSTARYLTLKGTKTLQESLRQLFVLMPVIDDYKHYYIDEREIEKLERYGEGWLDSHPEREFIYRRALRFKEVYKLAVEEKPVGLKEQKEAKVRLNDLRYQKITETAKQLRPLTIVDMGAGEGKLSVRLGFLEGVREIMAVEPSQGAALKAKERFEKAARKEGFVSPDLVWGSLFYYDDTLKGKDLMILCEVIEHIDAFRLPKVMAMILEEYRPKNLLITTPNKEYNELYDMDEQLRHSDHRFEWTREQFQSWCGEQNPSGDYMLSFDGIGEEHPDKGCPTQMCLFTRKEG